MKKRDISTNLQAEPSYPEHETVVVSFRAPDMVIHRKHKDCPIEYPHKIEECKLFF